MGHTCHINLLFDGNPSLMEFVHSPCVPTLINETCPLNVILLTPHQDPSSQPYVCDQKQAGRFDYPHTVQVSLNQHLAIKFWVTPVLLVPESRTYGLVSVCCVGSPINDRPFIPALILRPQIIHPF